MIGRNVVAVVGLLAAIAIVWGGVTYFSADANGTRSEISKVGGLDAKDITADTKEGAVVQEKDLSKPMDGMKEDSADMPKEAVDDMPKEAVDDMKKDAADMPKEAVDDMQKEGVDAAKEAAPAAPATPAQGVLDSTKGVLDSTKDVIDSSKGITK